MKKYLSIFLFAFIMNAGHTQTIPNGTLENWDSIHSQTNTAYWWQPSYTGYNWVATLNSLVDIPVTMGGPGPETCFRTTDSYSGTYAAKLVSKPLNLMGGTSVFLPGMLGTAVVDKIGIKAILGNPCPGCKPLHFKGYYKFEPVKGDSCTIVALVSRWNSQTHKRDTIAFNGFIKKEAVSAYTPFDLQLTYNTADVPDTLTYLMISSAGFNMNNFMLCQGQEGSTLYIDEISLEYPMGIQQSLMPDVAVKVYPNPATEQTTFELSERVVSGSVEIFSVDGKLVKSFGVNDIKTTVQINNLPSGTYYFKLKEGKHLLNTGSFIIQ